MQHSSIIGPAKGMVATFNLAVFLIHQNQQWVVKKYLLCLKSTSGMLFQAFSLVSSVPVKTLNLFPVNHYCILPSYTLVSSANQTLKFVPGLGASTGRLTAQLNLDVRRLTFGVWHISIRAKLLGKKI